MFFIFGFIMYGLYDIDGILRFVNSDRKACLDYAELFGFKSTNFSLMNLIDSVDISNDVNLDLNQEENNN